MADTATTFALIVLQAMPGNVQPPVLHESVEIRILSGEGTCSFEQQSGAGPGYVGGDKATCADRVTSIATVLVDGKVVADIPASVLSKEAIKLIYWQLSATTMVEKKSLDKLRCLSADAPLREVPCD